MSANSNKSEAGGARAEKDANGRTADDVRQAFSSLPFDQKVLTLVRVELDMVSDAVEAVAAAASKVLDEVANACTDHSTPAASGSSTS